MIRPCCMTTIRFDAPAMASSSAWYPNCVASTRSAATGARRAAHVPDRRPGLDPGALLDLLGDAMADAAEADGIGSRGSRRATTCSPPRGRAPSAQATIENPRPRSIRLSTKRQIAFMS